MRRLPLLPVLSLLGLLAAAGCEQPAATAPASDGIELSAAHSSAPGAPMEVPFSTTFPDDDPCTPVFDRNEHLVTISGTLFVHTLPNGNLVIHAERTITTDSGYEGRGEHTQIVNGNIVQLQLNDIVTNPDGRKFRAGGFIIVDLTTSPPSVRVTMGGLTCIKT